MSAGISETTENNVEPTIYNHNHGNSQFPDGMRVLVVDDSPVCLKLITLLLQKCRYQVTAKENSGEALTLLKQNEDNFDIVLTDVHMHNIDGFKLLEAGLEHDIPVIMISANDDLEIIKKGIIHGAVDYLVKPVSLRKIKNIWQHVYRKNLSVSSLKKDDREKPSNKDSTKRVQSKSINMEPAPKRQRIRWSPLLHSKFVDSVAKVGGVDKAVPMKILEMMGEKEISREQVASHLQKYRKAIKGMVEQDDGGDRNLGKNNNISISSRSDTGVSGTLDTGPISNYHHPIVVNNGYPMHQYPHSVANGLMNNSVSISSRSDMGVSEILIAGPNITRHHPTVVDNGYTMHQYPQSVVSQNHPGQPHNQQWHPSFGDVKSLHSDSRQHNHLSSYGDSSNRSSQDTDGAFFVEIPPVSGTGSLFDVILGNDFLDN